MKGVGGGGGVGMPLVSSSLDILKYTLHDFICGPTDMPLLYIDNVKVLSLWAKL